ncbi:MAG TPA: hypothetical protein VJS12_20520 [Steroidobacteraceae bacterium]|nr:hypothetical protein [Steroidobacteraceae bacterium]
METISVAAMVVVAAFAIERVSTALFFLLSFVPQWNEAMPDPGTEPDPTLQADLRRRMQLAAALVTGALALLVVWWFDIRILHELHVPKAPDTLDRLFSAVVLMGGSAQIGELLKGSKSPVLPAKPPEPIRVTGTLILEDPASARLRK